jgi:hypothetical protein
MSQINASSHTGVDRLIGIPGKVIHNKLFEYRLSLPSVHIGVYYQLLSSMHHHILELIGWDSWQLVNWHSRNRNI